ncbi:hypothetical protein EAG_12099 [Camponotus floridanus]|uniref:Uncharacterized protein n=1 Tax=Camponotus floridanus TaxID=104421 RepID=E2AHG1_CAMFO|nr:hypothetical protein EAG_12099 [Camponotus floridanus]
MEHVVGKYQYITSENLDEFLKDINKSEFSGILKSALTVEVQVNDDQSFTVTITNPERSVTNTFKLGEVYDEWFPSQKVPFKSVATKHDLGFQSETSLSPDLKLIRIYEFTGTQLIAVSAVFNTEECNNSYLI